MKKSTNLFTLPKKVTFFMLFFLLSLPGLAQKVTLPNQTVTIKQVMSQIEKQTGYKFFYNNTQINVTRKVTISSRKENLDEVLNRLFSRTNIDYKIVEKTIVLSISSEGKRSEHITSAEGTLGKRKVTGRIVDQMGEPIIGATVREKGTNNATVTDLDGNFTLLGLNNNSTLEVSYVGFQMKDLLVGNNTHLDITMKEDNKQLEEVVVVGYGVAKKSDFTGSLTSVTSDNIVDSHKQSAAAALQGTIAGVDITRNGNNPGSGFNIMVRGQNTITNSGTGNANGINSPLYVIDGMMMDNMNDIAPDDIERIDVLKDASSTAIYGSRGANGVVIVTTKNGSAVKEKTNVEYNGFISFTTANHLPDMLNGSEYADYKVERFMGNNWKDYTYTGKRADYGQALTTQAYNNYISGKSVDWVDALLQTAVSQNHALRVYGSSKGLVYSFGVGYTDEAGVTGTDNYKRYNFSMSIDKEIKN